MEKIIIRKIKGLNILLIPFILGFFHFFMLIFNSNINDFPLWFSIFWITLFYIVTILIIIGVFDLKFKIERYTIEAQKSTTQKAGYNIRKTKGSQKNKKK